MTTQNEEKKCTCAEGEYGWRNCAVHNDGLLQNEEKMKAIDNYLRSDRCKQVMKEFNLGAFADDIWQAAIVQGEQDRKFLLETVESLQFQLGDKIMKFEFQLSESQRREDELRGKLDVLAEVITNAGCETFDDLKGLLSGQTAEMDALKRKLAAYQAAQMICDMELRESGDNLDCLVKPDYSVLTNLLAAERNKVLAEMHHMEPVGYVRPYGVECLQGTLMNQTTGRIPLPSSTTIDPYPVTDDDIPLYVIPESPQPAAQSEGGFNG